MDSPLGPLLDEGIVTTTATGRCDLEAAGRDGGQAAVTSLLIASPLKQVRDSAVLRSC